MFFCERCRVRNSWPESFSRSHGTCELCRQSANCYDIPSRDLPDGRAYDSQRLSDVDIGVPVGPEADAMMMAEAEVAEGEHSCFQLGRGRVWHALDVTRVDVDHTAFCGVQPTDGVFVGITGEPSCIRCQRSIALREGEDTDPLFQESTQRRQVGSSLSAYRAAINQAMTELVDDLPPMEKKVVTPKTPKPLDYMAVVHAFTLEAGSTVHGCKETWHRGSTVRMTAYCGRDGIRESAMPEKPIDCKGCLKAIAKAVHPKKRYRRKRPNQWDRLAGKDPF